MFVLQCKAPGGLEWVTIYYARKGMNEDAARKMLTAKQEDIRKFDVFDEMTAYRIAPEEF